MADRNIGFFFRFAGIVAVVAIVCLFITEKGSAEFLISLLSLVLSVVVLVVCAILMNRKKK